VSDIEQSESITALIGALAKFQKVMTTVAATADNPFFKSKYADLASVAKAASRDLAENGLVVTQLIGRGTLTTMLCHTSGEWIRSTGDLHAIKDDPQANGSAITYMRRYAYLAILGLVADKDDDGNSATTAVTNQNNTAQKQKDDDAAFIAATKARLPKHAKILHDDDTAKGQGTLLDAILGPNRPASNRLTIQQWEAVSAQMDEWENEGDGNTEPFADGKRLGD
jgi:hypothetical protein